MLLSAKCARSWMSSRVTIRFVRLQTMHKRQPSTLPLEYSATLSCPLGWGMQGPRTREQYRIFFWHITQRHRRLCWWPMCCIRVHSCRVYNLKLNPHKCAFGVSSSQFLGFFYMKEASKSTRQNFKPSVPWVLPPPWRNCKTFWGRPTIFGVSFQTC